MSIEALQRALTADGGDPGPIDGLWGPRTRKALLTALRGDPGKLTEAQIADAAERADLTPAHVKAVLAVESGGRGFSAASRLPIILYEPHIFSRRTGRRFDAVAPEVSYRQWRTRPYPRTQGGRYDQMMTAVGLDPDAGLASASWGLFQIMGFNHAACGFSTPYAFARSMARNEAAQLDAFLAFARFNHLLDKLRDRDWAGFARGYNGPAYAANRYDQKLEGAYQRALA